MPNSTSNTRRLIVGLSSGLLFDYGIAVVLAIVCAYFSYATWQVQQLTGDAAAAQVADRINGAGTQQNVVIVSGIGQSDREFCTTLEKQLKSGDVRVVASLQGTPGEIAKALGQLKDPTSRIDTVATSASTENWGVWDRLPAISPSLEDARVIRPEEYSGSSFLRTENLLNILNQIAVIAIVAVGMTIVVISGGIDLSVGSLIALSAVVAARLCRDFGGGVDADAWTMAACCAAAVFVCAACGCFSAAMISNFGVPPFIATLSMMLIASGAAYLLAEGQSINQLPESFASLGRGSSLLHIPNAVALMGAVYLVAQVVMSRTTLGRYLYAIGGNAEAARLSGVPIRRAILLAYVICGALAGLGGIVLASQLRSGAPTYGQMYELYVIAAVVVGGTSLSGGEGRVFGTLLGALLIAVIQNGMNLTGVESYTQKIVLGGLILVALLLDRLRTNLIARVR